MQIGSPKKDEIKDKGNKKEGPKKGKNVETKQKDKSKKKEKKKEEHKKEEEEPKVIAQPKVTQKPIKRDTSAIKEETIEPETTTPMAKVSMNQRI